MRDASFGVIAGILLIFITIAGIISILWFLEIIVIAMTVCVIMVIIGIIIIAILFLFALGYFMVTKKPEVQEIGDYRLDDTIDSKDYDRKQ